MTGCILYKPLKPLFLRGCLVSVQTIVDHDRSLRWEVALRTHRATATWTNCDGERAALACAHLYVGLARCCPGGLLGLGVSGAWAEALLSFIFH